MEFYNEGKDYRREEITQVESWNLDTQKQFPDISTHDFIQRYFKLIKLKTGAEQLSNWASKDKQTVKLC